MKSRYMGAAALGAVLSWGLGEVAVPQTVGDHSVSGTQPAAATQPAGFTPRFDDLMTMLIQPRHVKLYYAGSRKNWELAAFESSELRSAFGRIARVVPKYVGNDTNQALQTIIMPRIKDVDAAIAAGDVRRFHKAYDELTAACNACHGYMEHPFLVIKVPDSAADTRYPDQEFKPFP